ncbi:hypothetical protein FE392_17885, partial [Xenorhabdus sp. 12]
FSVLLYSLLLPMASMNAFSEGERTFEGKAASETWLNSTAAPTAEKDNAGVIAQNIQRVSNLLSSSPAELTEQAKSYALGQINNTIATEAQQWLSRYGNARVNFSLDRKGKLDNSSVDLLLPLYDNKADWLLFTQLGYRHKDSRHTLNLGLGGRYFTPNWMYGINTFFDNDVTGKNKRLGVGGEAWTDYVKLSANTYWRLTEWHTALSNQDYDERPANGFDLNGEFYLPAYPQFGGKLAYEQYFGDNVALFNRDTKQKNPGLARFGVNYTPIPLVTMGVDYKYGRGGKSETLFQASLNYHFGTPFGDQLSPNSVASLRTLAGSRYDLVERNNNIVLEYKKKPEFNITLDNILKGFTAQKRHVTANIIAENPVKQINWQADPQFLQNGGVITSQGSQLELVLPKYKMNGLNDYTVTARADNTDGRQKSAQMKITVEPFVVKEKSVTKMTEGPLVANGQSAYDLAAVITYGTDGSNKPLANHTFSNVKWYLIPENKEATLTWDTAGKSDPKGRLTATLASKTPLDKNTQIYLVMDDMKDTKIGGGDGAVNFDNYKFVREIVQEPSGPLKGNGSDTYYFKIKVVNDKNEPVRNQIISGVTWKVKDNRDEEYQMALVEPENSKTDGDGYLVATLTSRYGFDEVIVEAILNSDTADLPPLLSKPVKFEAIVRNAGILMKSAVSHNFKKEFSAEEPERPHNVHDKLEVYLTRKFPGQTTADPITPDEADSSEHVQFSSDNTQNAEVDEKTGKITFPLATWGWNGSANDPNHMATVTATITDNTTGAKIVWAYKFNPKHYFYKPNNKVLVAPFYPLEPNKPYPHKVDGHDHPPTRPAQTCNPSPRAEETIPYPAGMGNNSKAFNDPLMGHLMSLINEYQGSGDPDLGIFNKADSENTSDNILVVLSLGEILNDTYRRYLTYDYKKNQLNIDHNSPYHTYFRNRIDSLNYDNYSKPTDKNNKMSHGYLLCLKNASS